MSWFALWINDFGKGSWLKFTYSEGATPLDEQSQRGLIPFLTTQQQLNEFEQSNINLAIQWAEKSRNLKSNLVSIEGVRLLHQKMFNQTWRWAGDFRLSDANIGCAWHQIPQQLKQLCDNVEYWDKNQTFTPIEIAVRLHHKLVQIYPFPNGNGRVSRLVADLFLEFKKLPRLTWGSGKNLVGNNSTRTEYLSALREADEGRFGRLMDFATK